MRRLAALVLVVPLVLAVAGCGETVLDATKTEEQLESSLEKSLPSVFRSEEGKELAEDIGVSAGVGIDSVECPTDQEIEKGAEFTCTVSFENGSEATETLRIVNEDADLDALGLSPKSGE